MIIHLRMLAGFAAALSLAAFVTTPTASARQNDAQAEQDFMNLLENEMLVEASERINTAGELALLEAANTYGINLQRAACGCNGAPAPLNCYAEQNRAHRTFETAYFGTGQTVCNNLLDYSIERAMAANRGVGGRPIHAGWDRARLRGIYQRRIGQRCRELIRELRTNQHTLESSFSDMCVADQQNFSDMRAQCQAIDNPCGR
jgi:hypothetical protein